MTSRVQMQHVLPVAVWEDFKFQIAVWTNGAFESGAGTKRWNQSTRSQGFL